MAQIVDAALLEEIKAGESATIDKTRGEMLATN
jgi:hypothetical protein